MKKIFKAMGICVGLVFAIWLVQGEAVERFVRASALILDGTPTASLPSTCVNGQFRYDSTLGKLVQCNANTWSQISGSGGGGLSYFDDLDADTVSNVTTYDDGASTPTDGTGGTVNYASTSSETSAPLVGDASYKLSKSANNAQGEGWAVDSETLDSVVAGGGSAFWVQFYYKTSANYAADEVKVYAYRAGSNTLEALNSFQGSSMSNSLPVCSGVCEYAGWLTASSSDTSIRLIFHIAGTAATAYDITVDRIRGGPSAQVQTAIIGEWDYTSWVPTIAGLGAGSATVNRAAFRRVGDSVEFDLRVTKDGTPGSGGSSVTVTPPPGVLLNDTKAKSLNFGAWSAYTSNSTVATNNVGAYYSQSTDTLRWTDGTGDGIGSDFAAGTVWTMQGSFPVDGWTSGNVMSTAELNVKTPSFLVRSASLTGSLGASNNIIKYDTATDYKDTHSGYSASTGFYTAPTTGYYQVFGKYALTHTTASGYLQTGIGVSGTVKITDYKYTSGTGDSSQSVEGIVYAEKGQTIGIYSNTSLTTPAFQSSAAANTFSIKLLSDLSVVGITGVAPVMARYTSTAGQSIANATIAIVDFATKTYDTHNAVTTGASWKFTAPVAGKYSVKAAILWASAVFSSNSASTIYIYKNGSAYTIRQTRQWAALTTSYQQAIDDTIQLASGDYIDVRIDHGESAARSIDTASGYTAVSIERLSD